MFKILLGNGLFAGCIVAWYFYTDGDRGLLLAGVVLALACFICGIFMGYILHGPGKIRRPASATSAQSFMTPVVLAEDAAQDEIEAEEAPPLDQPPNEPDQDEELDFPTAILSPEAEPVKIATQEDIETAATAVESPQTPPALEIHVPATTVVLDSDGCYEMVAKVDPADADFQRKEAEFSPSTPVLRYSEEPDSSTIDPALRSTSEPASFENAAPAAEHKPTTPDTSDFTL